MSDGVGSAAVLRDQILELVHEFHDAQFVPRPFVPGETPVPVSGRVFDADELLHLVDSSLDFWLTTGRYAKQFELQFARALGVRHALLCNSGSSANLLAVSALTSKKLGDAAAAGRRGDHGRRRVPDDGQPDPPEPARSGLRRRRARYLQLDVSQLEAASGPDPGDHGRAHAGNPFDLDAVLAFAKSTTSG